MTDMPDEEYCAIVGQWMADRIPIQTGGVVLCSPRDMERLRPVVDALNAERSADAYLEMAEHEQPPTGGVLFRGSQFEVDLSVDAMTARLRENLAPELAASSSPATRPSEREFRPVQAIRPTDWTYASGNAAAREVRMLPESFFRELLSESVPDGLLRRAGETVLRERIRTVDDLYDADRHAEETWEELLHEMGAACPTPAIEELFELPRLFRSFKSYVKREQFGLEVDPVPSRFSDADWEELWNGYAPQVTSCLRLAAVRARDLAKEEPNRPDYMDGVMDIHCLIGLRETAEQGAGAFIAEFYRHYGAVKGVEMLWRAREAGVDERAETLLWEMRQEHELFIALSQAEEETWVDLVGSVLEGLQVTILDGGTGYGRLRDFVRASDEWLMAHARDARNVPFGPERVFGFLLGMQAELQNLKMVLAGRALGVPSDVLTGRLRAVYV